MESDNCLDDRVGSWAAERRMMEEKDRPRRLWVGGGGTIATESYAVQPDTERTIKRVCLYPTPIFTSLWLSFLSLLLSPTALFLTLRLRLHRRPVLAILFSLLAAQDVVTYANHPQQQWLQRNASPVWTFPMARCPI